MFRADADKNKVSAEEGAMRNSRFAQKVLSASAKMPAPDTFKVWHANSDKEIGTDSPWGTTK